MGIPVHQFNEMLARVSRNKLRGETNGVPDDAEPVETGLHRKIISECRSRDWIVLHGSTAHRTHRTIGEFDLVVLGDGGRVWFIELKSKSGKLSVAQAALKAWAEKLSHKPLVIRSLSEFKAAVA